MDKFTNFMKSEKGKKITTGIIKGAAVVGMYVITWVGIKTAVSASNGCYDKVGMFVDKLIERSNATKDAEPVPSDMGCADVNTEKLGEVVCD